MRNSQPNSNRANHTDPPSQQPMHAIHEEETHFRLALDVSPVPFAVLSPMTDKSGTIIDFRCDYVNPAATDALGHAAQDLVGRHIGEARSCGWARSDFFERFVTVSLDGKRQCFELLQWNGNGSEERAFQVVALPLQASVAVWFIDISEQKRFERLLWEANRRHEEFLEILA